MPRKFKYTKEQILCAALDLIRESGFSALTARGMAKKLGTSTQPVFGYFENMADLQKNVISAARKIYREYLDKEINSGNYPPYKASGMAYIKFANEEKEFFKVLFMSNLSDNEKNDDETEAIVPLIRSQINISQKKAELFHLEMWTFVHGIATMIVTERYAWSEELISRALSDVYRGLKHEYENM